MGTTKNSPGCQCCGGGTDVCNFTCPSGTFPDLGSVTLECEDLFTITFTEDPAPVPEPTTPPFLDDCFVLYMQTTEDAEGLASACYGLNGDAVKRYILKTIILEIKFIYDTGDSYIQFEGELYFEVIDGTDCSTVGTSGTENAFFFSSSQFLIEDCDALPGFSCTLEDLPIYDDTGTPILQDFNIVMSFP